MTILLIDDHDLVLKGLLSVLRSAFPKTEFITARSGEEALEAVRGTHTDLTVLDLELPDIPGLRLIGQLRSEAPAMKIVVNTVHEEVWTLRQLEQCGVDGVVFKSVDSSQLIQTVRRVLEASPAQRHPGQQQQPQTLPGSNTGAGYSPLSPKELEILQLIAAGKDTRRIASTLYITENTVESHRRHIMRKLGAVNAADMVMKAVARGLIPPARLK